MGASRTSKTRRDEAPAREMLAARAGSLPIDVAYLAPPSFLVSRRRKADYFRASLGLLDAIPS